MLILDNLIFRINNYYIPDDLPKLWLVFLVCVMPLSFVLKKWLGPDRPLLNRGIKIVILVLGIVACIGPIIYLFVPYFIDHGEPHISSVAWIAMSGNKIYPDLFGSERYISFYGPLTFYFYGSFLKLFGPSYFAAKLGAFFAFILAGLIVFLFRKKYFGFRDAVFAGLLFAAVLPFFGGAYVWARGDILLVLLVAITGAFCFKKNSKGYGQFLFIGAAIGIAMNLKIHSIFYFLPFLAECFISGSLSLIFLGFILSCATFALPWILIPDQWITFIGFLKMGSQSVHFSSIFQNYLVFIVLVLPVLVSFSRLRLRSKVTLLFSGFAVAIISARPGAGTPHFMPFVPIIMMAAPKIELMLKSKLSTTALLAVLILALPEARNVQLNALVQKHLNLSEQIDQFAKSKPGSRIAVGVSDWDHYELSFQFTKLVWEGHPLIFDPVMEMDYVFMNIEHSQEYLSRLVNCEIDYWLLPKQGVPWSIGTWFSKKPMVNLRFRQLFLEHYEPFTQTRDYTAYQCKSSHKS